MATTRRTRNVFRKRRPTRKTGRKARVSKPLKRAIKAIAASEQETKFVAEVMVPATPLPNTVNTPANLYRMLPVLAQGDNDSNRIGLKVQPVSARTVFTFFFNGTSSAASWTQDKIVNLVIVKVKGHDSQAAIASTPGAAFLRKGDSTYVDPVYPAGGGEVDMLQQINHLPVNTNLYTVLKHYRFRLRKGTGNQNSAPSMTLGEIAPSGVPASEDLHTIIYNWKPPTLKYTGNLQTFPDAHAPQFLCWMTNADASPAAGAIVNFSAFSQMYFKDA